MRVEPEIAYYKHSNKIRIKKVYHRGKQCAEQSTHKTGE